MFVGFYKNLKISQKLNFRFLGFSKKLKNPDFRLTVTAKNCCFYKWKRFVASLCSPRWLWQKRRNESQKKACKSNSKTKSTLITRPPPRRFHLNIKSRFFFSFQNLMGT